MSTTQALGLDVINISLAQKINLMVIPDLDVMELRFGAINDWYKKL